MDFKQAIASWEPLNQVEAESLLQARLEAHWAAQIIGGTGEALVSPVPDFSHTSMTWVDTHRALVGQMTSVGVRLGLVLASMELVVLDDSGEIAERLPLNARTLEESLEWAISVLEKRAGEPLARRPAIPDYEMPDHPLRNGTPFSAGGSEQLGELARWYANASRLQSAVRMQSRGASPVRCWPHHFDIATLISFDGPAADPETARSIGFGLSPGDDSYPEPYFYVNPWPFPDDTEGGSSLDGNGHWHTEGWFGAVLPASNIRGSREEQSKQVAAFAESALAADRKILGLD